ncbi:hypothetical protein L1987_78308 [Smallanthus sonchifolius]|uniref:Uncharacterized protein n=1 Tax=Smallanthus sonchifolius TaxID=185202 RepID=A0ACB8ZDC5_9ASTR|nr:hypothetical protein L1987_78308 [Smallanthus sonchifolius]
MSYSVSQRAFNTPTNPTHGFRISCNGAPHDHNDTQKLIVLPNVDMRNILVGLGSLYTAASLTSLAAPITTPDITSLCNDVNSGINNIAESVRTRKCCPLNIGKKIKPFVFPKEKTVRMRWPAHRGTSEQVDKYRRAIQAMRDLPEDHPHSFNSQSKVHCAYCNGYYTQVAIGFLDLDIHIHNSWLFLPFHRWYLYFYERILGKLINDPTFALPCWKWDEPAGMRIPEIFIPKDVNCKPNTLYDVYRDAWHIKQVVIDLDFDHIDKGIPDEMQIARNLCTMYRDLIRNGGDTIRFFGGKYIAGDSPVANNDPSVGSLEAGSHTAVHRWVGDPTLPYDEDMGNFYSAGYDTVFYIHHVNVDRLWKLWKDLGIPGHKDPTDRDWLNASYVFYDENEELVRVYNKDSVDLGKFNYKYIENSEDVFPWRESRPAKCSKSSQVAWTREVENPVRLNKILKVRVKRPGVSRTEAEKAEANEVLLIKRIKFDSGKFVKFDVFVNDKLKEAEVRTPCDPEYAGEEYATVTLVPRIGCNDLTIGEIKIELVSIL